jgi:hypothetical protein
MSDDDLSFQGRGMRNEEISLTVADAWRMTDEELGECFWEVAREIIEDFGDDLPEDFPRETRGMTRAQVVAALAKYAYFFDPNGEHPKPPRREHDPRQLPLEFRGEEPEDVRRPGA